MTEHLERYLVRCITCDHAMNIDKKMVYRTRLFCNNPECDKRFGVRWVGINWKYLDNN